MAGSIISGRFVAAMTNTYQSKCKLLTEGRQMQRRQKRVSKTAFGIDSNHEPAFHRGNRTRLTPLGEKNAFKSIKLADTPLEYQA
jgi:hypothetical protein